MKVKVYQYGAYPRHNQIVVHVIDIEPLAENVYGYVVKRDERNPEYDELGIILKIGDSFFEADRASRQFIKNADRLKIVVDVANDYEAHLNRKMENNLYISLMDVKVYETLGKDTSPLLRYREAWEQKKEEKRKMQIRQREEEEQQKIRAEAERLDALKQDYLDGKEVSGEDFVAICKRDGLELNPRTVGTIYRSVAYVTKEGRLRILRQARKKWPDTNGVWKLIETYNSFLDTRSSESNSRKC